MADESKKPQKLHSLGWIEVQNLRPKDTDPKYAGRWLLNLDCATRIHFPENNPGSATVFFADGQMESLEDANHSRLLAAIHDAQAE